MLVVDDEESIRKVTGTVLMRHGYNVILAADGAEALVAFVNDMTRIKAVITDVMMPFIDGKVLVRALLSLNPEIKIIATTGHCAEARLAELREIHVGPCLMKPFNIMSLLTTLHELLHPTAGR